MIPAFIKVTGDNRKARYVNPCRVMAVHAQEGSSIGAVLVLEGGLYYPVRETPEEVYKKICQHRENLQQSDGMVSIPLGATI